ncbi:MAG: Phospho-N-acetylmuramoyl-pentapeptide-transferase, partial [Candidatus Peribacteria bacterium]|nr:Phospho-N-acetylmuramoyl-pentapeptide-transferase [Candidatus Peribacteria bacterium]
IVDDYINIVGIDEQKIREMSPTMKLFFALGILAITAGIVFIFSSPLSIYSDIVLYLGVPGFLIIAAIVLVPLFLLFFGGRPVNDIFLRFFMNQGARKGLAVLPKISSLLLIGLLGALWFYFKLERDSIHIPYFGFLYIGWLYIPLFVFIIVATANAVNVTDGLDGLAGGLLVIAFASFGLLAYLKGLYILSGFCAVTAGAIAAFLWHNVPPALFYMGDTGALALGGALGVIALLMDQLLVLPLVGFVFVVEMLSVIIQLTSKKFRGGKKVFKAAPIHHHFEALEWGESKVTMRLWIIGVFFAFLGIIVGLAHDPASANIMVLPFIGNTTHAASPLL